MTTTNWLTLIGIVSSGFIGYFIKYSLDKKAQFSSDNAKIKREIYQDYVEFTLKFLNNAQEEGPTITPSSQKTLIKETRKFHRKAVLYSSPKVVNAFSDMLQNSYRGNNISFHTMVLMTNVFKCMRKDIGLSNRNLRSGGIRLIRPLINDYDKVIRPHEIGLLMSARTSLNTTLGKESKDEEEK